MPETTLTPTTTRCFEVPPLAGDLTLSFWLQLNPAKNELETPALIFCKGMEPYGLRGLSLIVNPGEKPTLTFEVATSKDPKGLKVNSGEITFYKWHHVTCVVNSVLRNFRMFVDGKPGPNGKLKGKFDDPSIPFFIGQLPFYIPESPSPYPAESLDAKIQDFRLYTHALSDQEITNLMSEYVPEKGHVIPTAQSTIYVSDVNRLCDFGKRVSPEAYGQVFEFVAHQGITNYEDVPISAVKIPENIPGLMGRFPMLFPGSDNPQNLNTEQLQFLFWVLRVLNERLARSLLFIDFSK
jgi:hypothetical protein